MTDFASLAAAAFHRERVAARRRARLSGMSEEAALRETLEAAAGARGIDALLAERGAQGAADIQRKTARARAAQDSRAQRQTATLAPAGAWQAWFDGSAHPNPGRCGIGVLLLGPGGERTEISRGAGHGSSSEAEYRALIAALEAACEIKPALLVVWGDSQGVIDDARGSDAGGAAVLRPYRERVRELIAQLGEVQLRWIPRHRNAAADALSQRAFTTVT